MLAPKSITPVVGFVILKPAGVAVKVPLIGPPITPLTTIVVVPILQNVPPVIVALGRGFTVILNVVGVPGQLVPPAVKIGVTVIFPKMGAVPGFVAIKEGMFPEPFAPRPMAVLLFVQV